MIGDDVDIGANTTIDRGSGHDTVIGAGSMIDNLVQIGHNVVLGRCCILAGQVGISGSTKLGDFVMIGGQGGLAGHLHIGSGARIAAKAGLMRDVPPGATVSGIPAVPMTEFMRQTVALQRLAKKKGRVMIDPRCTESEATQIDIQRIMEMIPHRHPFLMIDKVVDVVANERATGIKNVSINENYFQGHFPARPVMPGVLIIEAMAQTAAVLVVHTLGPESEGKLVYFMSVDNARFRRPVFPGDTLRRPRRQAAQSRQCVEVRGPGQGRRQSGGRGRVRRDDPRRMSGAMARDPSDGDRRAGREPGAETSSSGRYCVVGEHVALQLGRRIARACRRRRAHDDRRGDADLSRSPRSGSSRRI